MKGGRSDRPVDAFKIRGQCCIYIFELPDLTGAQKTSNNYEGGGHIRQQVWTAQTVGDEKSAPNST